LVALGVTAAVIGSVADIVGCVEHKIDSEATDQSTCSELKVASEASDQSKRSAVDVMDFVEVVATDSKESSR
jgi:hypothetical protein